jgi:hypothetical protein
MCFIYHPTGRKKWNDDRCESRWHAFILSDWPNYSASAPTLSGMGDLRQNPRHYKAVGSKSEHAQSQYKQTSVYGRRLPQRCGAIHTLGSGNVTLDVIRDQARNLALPTARLLSCDIGLLNE